MTNDFPALIGLSDTEIKQAASFWLLFSQMFAAGEEVPPSVLLLDYRDLTQGDLKAARRVVERMLRKAEANG